MAWNPYCTPPEDTPIVRLGQPHQSLVVTHSSTNLATPCLPTVVHIPNTADKLVRGGEYYYGLKPSRHHNYYWEKLTGARAVSQSSCL